MDINTSEAVRYFYTNPSLYQVYLEAVANSLDANATDISIDISIKSYDEPKSLSITITDNGDGFNDDNFSRFKELLKPRDKEHKGVGRLIYLGYFKDVFISSKWPGHRREFIFNNKFKGKANTFIDKSINSSGTTIILSNFTGRKIKSYDDLTPSALKRLIMYRFFPTLDLKRRAGKEFKITISLNTSSDNLDHNFSSSSVTIRASDLPKLHTKTIKDGTLDTFSSIDIMWYIGKADGEGDFISAYIVDGRAIPEKMIHQPSVPLGYLCVFLFASELFTSKSNTSREELNFQDKWQQNQLKLLLRREISQLLSKHIPQITEYNVQTKEHFESSFPHLLGFFEEETVGLIDREEAILTAQAKYFDDQRVLLQCEDMDKFTYEKSLEISSRSLTEYILYRNKIIQKMKAMSDSNSESEIHNLIVPRYKEFSRKSSIDDIYQNNAWLLDDKFMTFRTILSDKRMKDVINAIKLSEDELDEEGRPDIAMIFSADPDKKEPVNVVIVEIKKKTDNEKDNQYAINQLLNRANKLADYCPNIERIWYYALLQINDDLARNLRGQRWAPLFSHGKVFYQELLPEKLDGTVVPTPAFVLSYDAIVADAESRNNTFLEILRSTMKQYSQKAKE